MLFMVDIQQLVDTQQPAESFLVMFNVIKFGCTWLNLYAVSHTSTCCSDAGSQGKTVMQKKAVSWTFPGNFYTYKLKWFGED